MKKNIAPKILQITMVLFALSFFLAPIASAETVTDGGMAFTGLSANCYKYGCCSLCDLINAIMNVAKFVIGIIGSVIFVYFIYGGIWLLVSHGNRDYITKGKNILINSTIGLAIVMLASVLVFFIVAVITGKADPKAWVAGQLTCPENTACSAASQTTQTTPLTQ